MHTMQVSVVRNASMSCMQIQHEWLASGLQTALADKLAQIRRYAM